MIEPAQAGDVSHLSPASVLLMLALLQLLLLAVPQMVGVAGTEVAEDVIHLEASAFD